MRGSYKPPSLVHADVRNYGDAQFREEQQVDSANVVHLAEITLSELVVGGQVEDPDFISRVDLLTSLGYTVLISDYVRLFRLRSWLRQYTNNQIGIALSSLDFNYLFDEKYYDGIEGGILEAMGKLFPDNTHVYVYPAIINGQYVDLNSVSIPSQLRLMLDYLIANDKFVPFKQYNIQNLHISARDVASKIASGDSDWESCVLPEIRDAIKSRGLFGYSKK